MPENSLPEYKAIFAAAVKAISPNENVQKEALANLSNLNGVFDADVIEDILANPDLLFIASNLIMLNEVNLNDCALAAEDLIPIAKKFKYKFIDVEHDKKEVVGAISEVTYSLPGTNKIIDEDEALELSKTQKVQLVIGGYLWRLINKQLCQLIELDSSTGEGRVSTSFEILYRDYWIGIDLNGDKNVLTSKIIKPNDPEFEKYSKMLRMNGGKGSDESGRLVYCILKNGILPTGAGIVAEPASGIKGVLAVDESSFSVKVIEVTESKTENTSIRIDIDFDSDKPIPEGFAEKSEEQLRKTIQAQLLQMTRTKDPTLENIINTKEISVTENIASKKDKIMEIKIESVEDISSQWGELVKNEASASVIADYIMKKYEGPAKEFAQKQKEKEDLLAAVEANKIAAEAKVKELEASFAELNKQLSEIRANQVEVAEQERFDRFMASLDETFEFESEEIRAFFTDEIKALDSDESFAKWMDKNKKFHKEKTKDFIKEKKDKKVEASTVKPDVNVKEVIASAIETKGQEISKDIHSGESLKDKMLASFTKNTTIGGKQLETK